MNKVPTRPLWPIVLMLGMLVWAGQARAYEAGFEYQLIKPPVPTSIKDQVEVVEMFWYGCPHCYNFEPMLEKWLKDKPANVKFVRIPAIFRDSWKLHAQAYYTAEVMGVSDKIHKPLFNAIHKKRQKLKTPTAIRNFFISQGVDQAEFDKIFNSFVVQSRVQRALTMTKRYGISGVPAMIVNGKYRTDAKTSSINDARGPSHTNMMKVTDFLIKQESAKLTGMK